MKYIMLIYQEENAVSPSDREHCYAESAELARDLSKEDKYLLAAPLHPTSTATSIRIREGKPLITDGPFAETREQLGGFFLVEARDLDEAIGIASRIPGGRWGTVEIRPVMEVSGLPEEKSSAARVDSARAHSTY